MAIFQKLRKSKDLNLAGALVVDLANIRVPVEEHEKVLIGGKLQDPFLFEYLDQIKEDIRNLGIKVPVFYLLDSLVIPFDMSDAERKEFDSRLNSSIFDENHIWRIGNKYQKADYAICAMVNELGAMVISSDRFRDHIQNGTIRRPKDLLQFSPRRSSRFVNHKFVNIASGRRSDTPLDFVNQPSNDNEYWQQWLAHANVVLPFLNQEFASSAKVEIENASFLDRALEPEREIQQVPVPTQPEQVKQSRKRPGKFPSIYCGDLWGLSKNIDSYVQIVGRLFLQDASWELRDFAAAPPIKATGAPKFKGFKSGQWIACEGILRRNNIGYYLESPEWANIGNIHDATFFQFQKKRTGFQSWGTPPWMRGKQVPRDEVPLKDFESSTPEIPPAPTTREPGSAEPEVSAPLEPNKELVIDPPKNWAHSSEKSTAKVPEIKNPITNRPTPLQETKQKSNNSDTQPLQNTEATQDPTDSHENRRLDNRKWMSRMFFISIAIAAIASALALIF